MGLVAIREFILSSYHDLPNVLLIGSLILGSVFGYLPLVWVGVGMIFNGAIVSILQGLLAFLFTNEDGGWAQVVVPKGSYACEILKLNSFQAQTPGVTVVAPSHWLAAAAFFATFSIYNSINVAMKQSAPGVSQEKADIRRAFSLSVMVIGIFFFGLILIRGFTGCETWLGSILGILVGGGVGVGYWHMLDACGTGMVPDVLQVIGSMAPPGENKAVPIVCSPNRD